jgi:hypothetical protein
MGWKSLWKNFDFLISYSRTSSDLCLLSEEMWTFRGID